MPPLLSGWWEGGRGGCPRPQMTRAGSSVRERSNRVLVILRRSRKVERRGFVILHKSQGIFSPGQTRWQRGQCRRCWLATSGPCRRVAEAFLGVAAGPGERLAAGGALAGGGAGLVL